LAAVKSAQKAILVNRVSDGMLLWGVLWLWYYAGCLEYDCILLNETSNTSMFIVISVLIGAMGKSAQILFHVWLADAMEGKCIFNTPTLLGGKGAYCYKPRLLMPLGPLGPSIVLYSIAILLLLLLLVGTRGWASPKKPPEPTHL
jgi:hypothetical protein